MDLYTYPYDEGSDHAILNSVTWGLRSTFHSTLNSTQGQLTFGHDIIINATYIAEWYYIHDRNLHNTLRNNTKENNNRISHTYIVGNQLFVSTTDTTRKLNSKASPYKIVQYTHQWYCYILLNASTFAVFIHYSNLNYFYKRLTDRF